MNTNQLSTSAQRDWPAFATVVGCAALNQPTLVRLVPSVRLPPVTSVPSKAPASPPPLRCVEPSQPAASSCVSSSILLWMRCITSVTHRVELCSRRRPQGGLDCSRSFCSSFWKSVVSLETLSWNAL